MKLEPMLGFIHPRKKHLFGRKGPLLPSASLLLPSLLLPSSPLRLLFAPSFPFFFEVVDGRVGGCDEVWMGGFQVGKVIEP